MKDEKQTIKDNLVAVAIVAAMFGALFLFFGCSPRVIHETETVIEYRDRVVHDTTTFEIEKEVEKVVTRDTVSHLENTYAKSDAVVSEGFLRHSLESKPQVIYVPYEVHVTDTLIVEKEAIETEKIVEVEKPLTWWQEFRLRAFWWLVAGIVILLAWTFRKQIFKGII